MNPVSPTWNAQKIPIRRKPVRKFAASSAERKTEVARVLTMVFPGGRRQYGVSRLDIAGHLPEQPEDCTDSGEEEAHVLPDSLPRTEERDDSSDGNGDCGEVLVVFP